MLNSIVFHFRHYLAFTYMYWYILNTVLNRFKNDISTLHDVPSSEESGETRLFSQSTLSPSNLTLRSHGTARIFDRLTCSHENRSIFSLRPHGTFNGPSWNSVVSIQSRLDTNSSSDIAQKFRSLHVHSLRVNMTNILSEYSSSFQRRMWNYLHLNWINLYRNDVVSKRP